MNTNTYTDLVRDSKLLKKLLANENTEFKLSQCQEIVSKLYRFSSFHEAQQVLSSYPKAISPWTTEKPNYQISLKSIYSALIRLNLDKNIFKKAQHLLDLIVNNFVGDREFICLEELQSYLDYDLLIQNKNTDAVINCLEWVPGSDLSGLNMEVKKHYMLTSMTIQELVKPYLLSFDSTDKTFSNVVYSKPGSGMSVLTSINTLRECLNSDTYIYAPPGNGKTLWATAMLQNWMYKNPGSKIVIFDIGPCWEFFVQYLKHTYTQIKIFEFTPNEYNDYKCTDTDFINADVVLINFDNIESTRLSDVYKKWLLKLEQLMSDEQKNLFILDEAHRVKKLILPRTKMSLQYVVLSQLKDSLPSDDRCYKHQFDAFLCAGDPKLVWITNGNRMDFLLKYRLSQRIGYLKAIDLLANKMKFNSLYRNPEFDLDLDTTELYERIDKYIESNLL